MVTNGESVRTSLPARRSANRLEGVDLNGSYAFEHYGSVVYGLWSIYSANAAVNHGPKTIRHCGRNIDLITGQTRKS
jgi:hypothetical protein